MISDSVPHGTSGKTPVHQEDVLRFITDSLSSDINIFHNYGYDLYLPQATSQYAIRIEKIPPDEAQRRGYEISAVFLDSAWELCRRGILRPGITTGGAQSTEDGNAGNGYSITPFGKGWLKSDDKNSYVPTEPERFAQLLNAHVQRFGLGFHQRAQEALRCYGAHAYLASCVMSGAAAESILLATASKKAGESEALQKYQARDGRRSIVNLLTKGDNNLKNEVENQLSLLKYWRDSTAHGIASKISADEAFVALDMLLRCAHFFDDNWDNLISI